MILLLGATSYIGKAFARELRARGECFIPLSRGALDYTQFDLLFGYVRSMKPAFVINAGGIWNGQEPDESEKSRAELLQANTLLPRTIGTVCAMTNTPWGHVSSACIYNGAKVFRNGEWSTETDLNRPDLRRLFARQPDHFLGFNELDDPNFCFRSPPCTYTAGTKALAEEWLRGRDRVYVWRSGMGFDEFDGALNLLSRLQTRRKVVDDFVALSHLQDFARGCLGLIERNAAFGIYNVTNGGAVTTREIAQLIERKLRPAHPFEFWSGDGELHLNGAWTLSSSCILDSSKMARAGVGIRSARAALEDALDRWQPNSSRVAGRAPTRTRGKRYARIVPLVQR